MFPQPYQNNSQGTRQGNNGQPRFHTPEPNPGHNSGRIDYSPRARQMGPNGQMVEVATSPDRVVDMQVTYTKLAARVDRATGQPRFDRTTGQLQHQLYIWGRVNRHQMLGVTFRADLATLQQAAANLQRGVIVSFTGYVGVGTRNINGRPELMFNGIAYGDLKQGEVTVPFTQPVAAAPVAYQQPPAQYMQPQQFGPPQFTPQNFIPQQVMPQGQIPAAPQTYIPAPTVAAPAPTSAEESVVTGNAPF